MEDERIDVLRPEALLAQLGLGQIGERGDGDELFGLLHAVTVRPIGATVIEVQLLLGAIGSFLWAFVLAAVALRTKRWRNGRLMARGESGYKDCIFSWPVVALTTILGVLACGGVALAHGSVVATALAAVLGPTSLGVVPIVAAISQARGGAASRD